jgi:hypothetical protein
MKNRDRPCCAADAMRRVKTADVNGATVGLDRLDPVLDGVQAYAAAVHRENANWNNKGGIR